MTTFPRIGRQLTDAPWKCVVLTALFSFSIYLNTFSAGFAYDDNRAILSNQDLRPETPWLRVFQDDFWGTPLRHSGSHKSYRPLCVLTFRLNYYFGGLEARGYHVVNVILHTIVSALFTYFCIALTNDLSLALAAGSMFAVHPIHTEAVAGIVGRADVGSGLFFILTLLLYRRVVRMTSDATYCTDWFTLCACAFLGALATFTKEIGVTAVPICAAYDVFVISNFRIFDLHGSVLKAYKRGSLLRVGILSIAVILILYARLLIMGNSPPDFAPSDNPAASSEDLWTRLLTFLYLPVFNFLLLLYPAQLSFDWSMDSVALVTRIVDPRNAITIAFYCLCGAAFLICQQSPWAVECLGGKSTNQEQNFVSSSSLLTEANEKVKGYGQNGIHVRESPKCTTSIGNIKKEFPAPSASQRSTNVSPFVLLGVLWMALSFLPATNLFFYVGFVVAERILYTPSMGYCLLLGVGWVTLYRRAWTTLLKRGVLAAYISLLLVFSARTLLRNEDWQSEESLYRSGIHVNPPKAWGNLANVLAQQNKVVDAEEAYKAALRFRPNMADTHYNLGILLQNRKRYEEAAEYYQNAIKYRPKLASAYLNLGILYDELGNKKRALEVLRSGQNISDFGLKDPKTHQQSVTSIRYNIGKILFDLQKYQESLDAFLEALAVMPEGYAAHSLYNMMGQAFSALGRHVEAEAWYRKALNAKPDHSPAHLTFARHLHIMGRAQEAEFWFKKAFQIKPVTREAYIHYVQFLISNGKVETAFSLLRNGWKESPSDAEFAFYASGIFREQSKYDEAEMFNRKAVELKPNEISYLMNLGALLHLQRKWVEAEQIYLQILTRDPGQELTLGNLRKLQAAKRKAGH